MSRLDDIIRDHEQDPLSAVVMRLGALSGTAESICQALDDVDHDLSPDDLHILMELLRSEVTKTDEMMLLWGMLETTGGNKDEG